MAARLPPDCFPLLSILTLPTGFLQCHFLTPSQASLRVCCSLFSFSRVVNHATHLSIPFVAHISAEIVVKRSFLIQLDQELVTEFLCLC